MSLASVSALSTTAVSTPAPWLNGRSGRAWLDPRTKAFALIAINVVTLSTDGSATAWTARSFAMGIVAVLWLSVGRVRTALTTSLAFAVGLVLVQYARLLPGQLALIGGIGTLVVQFIPLVAMASYLVYGTQVSEAVAAMERMRLPRAVVIPFTVVLRFLPTIAQEHRSISDAMRMRGIGFGGRVRSPLAMLEYRVVPLLVSLVRIGDELTVSALTRGLGGSRTRTHVSRTGFGWRDALLAVAVLIPVVALLGGGWRA